MCKCVCGRGGGACVRVFKYFSGYFKVISPNSRHHLIYEIHSDKPYENISLKLFDMHSMATIKGERMINHLL